MPVQDLLYVGKATQRKLNRIGVKTIGQLAQTDEKILTDLLGKWGSYIRTFARGRDESPVLTVGEEAAIKSIGNSLTVYRDLKTEDDVEIVIWLLADSVASRMREAGLSKARTVQLYMRDSKLAGYRKQGKLPRPTNNTNDIARFAFGLFKEAYPWDEHVRGLGLSVTDFITGNEQLVMFADIAKD